MRTLVVGGTGFIGEALCRELDRRGNDVTAMARDPAAADLPGDVDRVAGDVTDYDAIEPGFEAQDAVVNLVALSPLFRPAGGNEMHFTVHRDGTDNVVRAAEAHGVDRLVQMSALGADPDADTAYLQSKGLAEAIVRESALEWTLFRPSVVFGEGEEFIPYTKLLAPPYLTPLPGGGETRFQPIWIGDLVPMLADAVEGAAAATDGAAGDADDDGSSDEPSDDAGSSDAGDPAPDGDSAETATDGNAGDERNPDAAPPDDDRAPAERGAEPGGPAPDGNPHAGRVYEIGGPEVLTLAEVAALAHAADGKPVDVVSIPMPLAKIGLSSLGHVPAWLLDALPGVPRMGADQYRSLQFDNTVADNDVTAFGVDPADLTTVAEYLDVDPVEP
jgi:NADH dehydrogenase